MSKKIRSDQEWLELIQECRASGLPVRNWCQTHSISIKTFYNKVSILRKKSCDKLGSQAASPEREHQVVPLEMTADPAPYPDHFAGDALRIPPERAAVTVRMPGYSVEIADGASEVTIHNTLLALGRLC